MTKNFIVGDDSGAVCRCFNWREAQRTMLTEQTTDAVLVLEQLDRALRLEPEAALHELANLIRTRLGGDTEIHLIHKTERAGMEA